MIIGIELDEIPTDCYECPFQIRFKDGVQDDWYMRRCTVKNRAIEYPKPEWCPLKEQPEWIPASERLPNDNEDILAYCVYEEESCIVPANYYNGEFFNCIFNTVMRCEITHWMPLPKPPKKGCEVE